MGFPEASSFTPLAPGLESMDGGTQGAGPSRHQRVACVCGLGVTGSLCVFVRCLRGLSSEVSLKKYVLPNIRLVLLLIFPCCCSLPKATDFSSLMRNR